MKTKKLSRSKLVKKLDAIFSQYVRLYYSDKRAMCDCYTCWTRLKRNKIQNGHFITRGNYKYRWDIDNCRPQCIACNIFLHWNYIPYTINMIREYWEKKILKMKNDKQIVKITTAEIMDNIDKYTDMVNELLLLKRQKLPLKNQRKSV